MFIYYYLRVVCMFILCVLLSLNIVNIEAARSSDADAGCACAYTVAVLPNCAYAFSSLHATRIKRKGKPVFQLRGAVYYRIAPAMVPPNGYAPAAVPVLCTSYYSILRAAGCWSKGVSDQPGVLSSLGPACCIPPLPG